MLGWLSPKQFGELEGLNTVRNSCGHGWQLSPLIRRGVKRKAPKRPVLQYKGKNVYKTEALIKGSISTCIGNSKCSLKTRPPRARQPWGLGAGSGAVIAPLLLDQVPCRRTYG